jgi:hypothetical protein
MRSGLAQVIFVLFSFQVLQPGFVRAAGCRRLQDPDQLVRAAAKQALGRLKK